MKKLITLVLITVTSTSIWSQNFSTDFQGPTTTTHYLTNSSSYNIDANSNKYSVMFMANDQSTNSSPFYIDYASIDLNGDLQSLIKYKATDVNYSIKPHDIITLPNNTQLITGTRSALSNGTTLFTFIMNINTDGTINWAKEINTDESSPSLMKLLPDGSVVFIFGYSFPNIGTRKVFCKIDANGTFSNYKQSSLSSDRPIKMVSNNNGTFDLITIQGNLLNINNDLSAINWTRKYFRVGGIIFNKTQNGDYIFASCQSAFGHTTVFSVWSKTYNPFIHG